MLTLCASFIGCIRAGGPIRDESNTGILNVPPLSVLVGRRMVEKIFKEDDGENKRVSQLERELLAVTAEFNDKGLQLVCFDVLTILESSSSGEPCHSSVSICIRFMINRFHNIVIVSQLQSVLN